MLLYTRWPQMAKDGSRPLGHTDTLGDSEPTEGLAFPRRPGLIHL